MLGIYEIIYFVFYAMMIGAISFVYVCILQRPNMVLGPIVKVFDRFFTKPGKLLRFRKWIYKPIMECAHCNGGQFALWFYLYNYWEHSYSLFWHIGFIAIAVLTVEILINKYGE